MYNEFERMNMYEYVDGDLKKYEFYLWSKSRILQRKDDYNNTRFPKIALQGELSNYGKYEKAGRYSLPSFRKFRPEIYSRGRLERVFGIKVIIKNWNLGSLKVLKSTKFWRTSR